MVISGGTLVSDCHGAIIYMEGEEYRCMRCMKPCKSAGTLSEQYERDNAIPKEHQRLKDEVIESAKVWRDDWLIRSKPLRLAVDALIAFEAEHGIGE